MNDLKLLEREWESHNKNKLKENAKSKYYNNLRR